MNNRYIVISGLTLAGLLLSACLPTQIPFHGISPPSVPSLVAPTISVPAIPPITIPTITIPRVVVPTVNAPAIGLTLVNWALSTPAASAGTPVPAVPVTGQASPDAARWFLYGLAALIGVVIVIMAFARFVRQSDDPNKSNRWTGRREE